MDEVTQEIRQALLGNLVTQDKRLVVTDSWIIKYRYGLVDGFDHVLVFGVMRKMRWYQMPGSREQIREQLKKAMMDMGRLLDLQTRTDAENVYCSFLLNCPVVLTCSVREKEIEVSAYAGRGISGFLATLRAFHKFERLMPETFMRLDSETSRQKTAEEKSRQRKLEEAQREKQRLEKEKQDRERGRKTPEAKPAGTAKSTGTAKPAGAAKSTGTAKPAGGSSKKHKKKKH